MGITFHRGAVTFPLPGKFFEHFFYLQRFIQTE